MGGAVAEVVGYPVALLIARVCPLFIRVPVSPSPPRRRHLFFLARCRWPRARCCRCCIAVVMDVVVVGVVVVVVVDVAVVVAPSLVEIYRMVVVLNTVMKTSQ